MITTPEIIDAVPIILSLILIEGLLSVDNALAIAAMASHLPGKQKYKALRYGIFGAYAFRGLALLFAAWIISNPWLKILGAVYLLYLMFDHFVSHDDKTDDNPETVFKPRGFWATIFAIEVMDLSLSVDNVVAAVAFSPKLWVVCAGVFIGILALRFVAGYCIKLIEKFPVLEHTAFLLIGYVGIILVCELTLHIEVSSFEKFIGIIAITALSIVYSKLPKLQFYINPVLNVATAFMRPFTSIIHGIISCITWPFKTAHRVWNQRITTV